MTFAKLTGLAPHFANLEVILNRPTLVGRGSGERTRLTPDVDRFLPLQLRRSIVDAIAASGPSTEDLSTSHALLYPEGDTFKLTDLGSANGTFYRFFDEERQLFFGATYVLRQGDVISLGSPKRNIRFRFEYCSQPEIQKPSPSRPTITVASIPVIDEPTVQLPVANYGLLVGNRSNLQGVHNDVQAMERMLSSRRGFRDHITTLLDERAIYDSVISQLDRLGRSNTPESLIVFYFSGHGRKRGDLDLYGPMKLSPTDLFDRIDSIRGQKLVIVDACHSGHFAYEEIIPPKTMVIASTSADDYAYEGPVGRKKMGYLTRALTKIINASAQRIDLRRIQEELGRDYLLAQHGQQPEIKGTTIYMRTQVISLDD